MNTAFFQVFKFREASRPGKAPRVKGCIPFACLSCLDLPPRRCVGADYENHEQYCAVYEDTSHTYFTCVTQRPFTSKYAQGFPPLLPRPPRPPPDPKPPPDPNPLIFLLSFSLSLSLASCFSLFFCPPSALRWLRVVVLPPLVEKRLPPPPLFDTPITQEQHAVDLPRIATPGRIATPRAPSVPGRGGLMLWRTSVVLVSESRETGNEKHPCFSSPCPSFFGPFLLFLLASEV